MECVFCKIIKNEIPCTKLFENKKVLAFLDINPATKGHALIIPKAHYENIYEIPENDLKEVISVVKKIAIAAKKALNAKGINILQSNERVAGQVVFHLHFHVFPRFEDDGQSFKWKHFNYKENEAKEIAEKIRKEI